MTDRHATGSANPTGHGPGGKAEAFTETFAEALNDAVAGRVNDAGLTAEEQDLLRAVSVWLPSLPEALANLEPDAYPAPRTVRSARSDDPIARMLGLVEDSAVTLDGRRLASARKAAGLNIAHLASRLQVRGWDVSVGTVSAWERNRVKPPPATINAIAQELGVAADTLLASSHDRAQTLDVLFSDDLIAGFLAEWARETNVSAQTLTERSKRLLATAGKRNATSATPATLLAILRHFRNSPGFESPE